MNEKFIIILEELDEGFAGAVGKHNQESEAQRDKVEAACTCGGKWGKTNKRSLKSCNHQDNCGAAKKGLLGEDLEEEELLEGRPKKDRSNEEPKIPGKRGRPKKDAISADDEDDGSEGVRDITLHAEITAGRGKNKQSANETEKVKGAKVENIKKIVKDFEQMLTVKYANKWDYDESEVDVFTKDNLGWTGAKAEDQVKDDDGTDPEDESFALGRKEK
jgi:hypothetical protein